MYVLLKCLFFPLTDLDCYYKRLTTLWQWSLQRNTTFYFTLRFIRSICGCVYPSLAHGDGLLRNPSLWKAQLLQEISTVLHPNPFDKNTLGFLESDTTTLTSTPLPSAQLGVFRYRAATTQLSRFPSRNSPWVRFGQAIIKTISACQWHSLTGRYCPKGLHCSPFHGLCLQLSRYTGPISKLVIISPLYPKWWQDRV